MTTGSTTVNDRAYVSLKEQAAYNTFSNLIYIALETGNTAGAQSRYQQAKEFLNEQLLGDLRDMALEDFGVVLD